MNTKNKHIRNIKKNIENSIKKDIKKEKRKPLKTFIITDFLGMTLKDF